MANPYLCKWKLLYIPFLKLNDFLVKDKWKMVLGSPNFRRLLRVVFSSPSLSENRVLNSKIALVLENMNC